MRRGGAPRIEYSACGTRESLRRMITVTPNQQTRSPQHREQYDADSQQPNIAEYDNVGAAFQTSRGLDETGWTERSPGRWRSRESLHGRDRPRDALNALGFELR